MNANLKVARIKMGYNQKQLAEKVGVSSKYISRLESTETLPSPDVMKRIASALNCSVQELFFEK